MLFRSPVTITRTPIKNHTHGASAANRSTGNLFVDQLARLTGLNPYYYQCSKTDQRRGRDGSRTYFWSKDLQIDPKMFCPAEKDFIVMIDVDQYVDIPEFLAANQKPLVIYTFRPGSAGESEGEYSFSFDKDSYVTYHVTGGATYKHRVWNYINDSFGVYQTFLGIPTSYTAYLTER